MTRLLLFLIDFQRWNFIPYSMSIDSSHVAKLFCKEVFCLHGLPSIIVFDYEVKFVSYFWKTLRKLFGATSKYSYTFQPQTGGKLEVVNYSLGDLLRSLVGEKLGNWDLILSIVEFAYNNCVNLSMGKSPFQVVTRYSPRYPIDLVPLPFDLGR